ncbi:hypothetical protein CEUSTIGMA_g13874.t1 [Chlamydomonas eustigma]|uniref:Integrase catalytic domain-containing protein n=1 Tax=Chlamydomonas eustigma TaxID=1157962 RepID=A0A250XTT5_9CHLO|nr:hypothetical protein CEUSTIGMA_g13874.t1 [Chlamydomonas eustigma]|eukprot:GAX86464.1 hypothetical protein CEUSTIGMA_g13874.t1 [Chlamydomonas eustigma]
MNNDEKANQIKRILRNDKREAFIKRARMEQRETEFLAQSNLAKKIEHVALRGIDDPPQRSHQAAAGRGAGGSSKKGRRSHAPVRNNRAGEEDQSYIKERGSIADLLSPAPAGSSGLNLWEHGRPSKILWNTSDQTGYEKAINESTPLSDDVTHEEFFWNEWEEKKECVLSTLPASQAHALIKQVKRWVARYTAAAEQSGEVAGNTHVPVLPTGSITALNSAALHQNYASLPTVNSDDLFQELNNEPDADLSSVPEPLFPLGSTPTGPGSPGWSIETHVPHGDKDPVDSQKVFKAPEGWTICAHHPLMVDGDVASIHALMLEQQGCFAKELSDLHPGYTGPVGAFKLVPSGTNIIVPSTVQVRPPRRRSPLEDQVMDEANLPLLDVGFIEECPNPVMSHECVIVVKKNPDTREWTDKRCCVNYGAQSGGINAYTTQDFYQLPLPEDLFRKTEGSKFFSVIDMKSGFMQTPMDPTVRPYCAFWWRKKLWQPTRNNFGLKNMPAYFQQVMDKTLADAGLAAHACVFIDDVLIFTEDLETHLQLVAKLFAAFKLVNLKAHPGKSRICFPCIEYLGHNIGSLGLTPNEVKVAAIRALPNPSNISELRRVLGFANYYRGYVPHFSEIAKPLTDLLKKDVKWEWTAERASAWRDLKDALCCPDNALRHPDRNVRLTQLTVQYPDQLPLEAWSSAFTALPQNVYAITEEHLSFAGALEEDPILLIAGFECADLSPAGSRKGLQGSKSSTFYPLLSVLASLQRMRSSCAFPLAYLIENTATQYAYGSSRAMKDSFHELCAKIGSPVVLDAANVGSYAHRLRNYWTNLVSSSALQCILDSFERDPDLNLSDVLYTTNPQICTKTRSYPWCTANVPGKLLKESSTSTDPDIWMDDHTLAFLHDPGMDLSMHSDAERKRILRRASSYVMTGKLLYRKMPDGLMYRWSLDTAGPFEPTSRGHTRVLVCVEHFSKFVEVFPLKDKSSAEIAYHFLHGVIARYGAPAEVLTDGGGEFQAEFDDLLLKCLIDHRVTSPHHPEANGASERFVKTVKTGIARYVESTGSTSEWDLFLPWIAYGYRVTPHESTKLSPYKMVYAVDPIMPSSAREHLTAPISYDDPEIAAKSVLDRSLLLAEHCATAGQNLLITQHRDTLRYAKLRSGAYMPQLREFKLGQFVYIKDHDSMHDSAKSLILRVKEVRPSGVLILMGRDNKTLAVNSKHCTPCHLPITEIEEASFVFAKPTIDLPWVTELTIKTLWATDQFYQDARRAKEFRPTSGPRHKQRGRPRNTTIPAAGTASNAPALLLKRGPGRPKKIPTALVALMPTYKWSYPRAVEQGLPDLLPGISDPAFSKHISSFSPGGNRFKQHFSPVSATELSTLLHLLDDSYSHSILDITHGAAAGVILHLPASESFSITTNEYLCDIPADFHLDPMQPESYTLIKEHHSMHIIIVCPALPLADILIPLTSIFAQHVACCLISKKYFLHSYYSRYAWLISLRAEDRLYIIPSDNNSATDNVWMLIFSSSGVKHSTLRDSKDQLTGILLASSEYVLTS